MFHISFTDSAEKELKRLKHSRGLEKRYLAVVKALKFLLANPRHPGLQTHKYSSVKGPHGEEMFEAYAEQNTTGAYRIFFCYGPAKSVITVVEIIPHP